MESPKSAAHALCQRSIASNNRPLDSGPCHLRDTQPNSARSHRQCRPPQSPQGVSGGPSHRTSTPSRFLKWRMPSTYSNFGYRCPACVAPCRWAAFGGGFDEPLGFRQLPSEDSNVVDESSDQPESEEPESDESDCRSRPFRARLALAFSRRRFFFSFSRTCFLRSLAKISHCVRTACILRTQRLGYSPKNTCHLFTRGRTERCQYHRVGQVSIDTSGCSYNQQHCRRRTVRSWCRLATIEYRRSRAFERR